MLLLFVALALFVVVIVVVDTMFFLFIEFLAASSLHLSFYPLCVSTLSVLQQCLLANLMRRRVVLFDKQQ